MANQEGEVEFPQDVLRDDCGVVELRIRMVRIRSCGGTIRGTVDAGFRGPDATFLSLQ